MATDRETTGGGGDSGREVTYTAIGLGILLSVVMGAANVYLGLRVSMTVSASIPAAVIAMGLLNGVMGRKSIREANLVQTGASAGESLAAGIIFTMPALLLVGIWEEFDFWITTLIAMGGGLLGILFMIPMRRVFVVDNPELKFPEGLACAEVLRAGQEGEGAEQAETGAKLLIAGLGLGAAIKLAGGLFGLLKSTAEWATMLGSRVFFVGADLSPALLAVGTIVGLSIAVQIFIGGAIGWLIAIPLMKADPSAESSVEAAYALWSGQVRYIGVGAMLVGGLVSIWNVRRGLVAATEELLGQFSGRSAGSSGPATERNLPSMAILALLLVAVAVVAGVYYTVLDGAVGITVLTTGVMIVMAFFFTAVASYIVGLVGNSNSPVSGMTITAVLATGLLVYLFGYSGSSAILATLGVAGIVCCAACTSGDVCNDLKTGHLVGASPRNQQLMQILGVLAAAFVMAPVMTILHEGDIEAGGTGIGGKNLTAAQAVLFKSLVDGFFGEGELPWNMVGIGVGIGIGLLIVDLILQAMRSSFRLYVMPVAVGMYLPFGLATPILAGGILNYLISRRGDPAVKRGILICSGLIAGESLVGVALGATAYAGIESFDLLEGLSESAATLISLAVMGLLWVWILWQSRRAASA